MVPFDGTNGHAFFLRVPHFLLVLKGHQRANHQFFFDVDKIMFFFLGGPTPPPPKMVKVGGLGGGLLMVPCCVFLYSSQTY